MIRLWATIGRLKKSNTVVHNLLACNMTGTDEKRPLVILGEN